MNQNLQNLIQTCTSIGVVSTLEMLGISSGEISQRKAAKVYGKYFVEAERQGRIRPCRIEEGHAGTRWFRVADILKMKTQDLAEAELQ